MPKREKLLKFLQNEDIINEARTEEINRASDKKLKDFSNDSSVQK